MVTRTFGFECEMVAADRQLRSVADVLAARKLGPTIMQSAEDAYDDDDDDDDDDDYDYGQRTSWLHSYHCGCDGCNPERSGPVFTYQQDCTVSAEFITKILDWRTKEADSVIAGLSSALTLADVRPNIRAGFHVHVGKNDLSPNQTLALNHLFIAHQEELALLAAQGASTVRMYNRAMDKQRQWPVSRDDPTPSKASLPKTPQNHGGNWWLRDCGVTAEFRLWNSAMSAWRLRMAVDVSTAFVDAAAAGLDINYDDPVPTMIEHFQEALGDKRASTIKNYVNRQIRYRTTHNFDVAALLPMSA